MPDATSVAQSHDATQMLFYFICTLGTFVAALLTWVARSILIPFRDAGITYLKNQTAFAAEIKTVLIEFGPARQRLHDETVKRFDKVDVALEKILREINAPPN